MEQVIEILQNYYVLGLLGIVTGVVVAWLINRYTQVAADFAPTLQRLLRMAEDIFGHQYPRVFAIIQGVAQSAELAQDGLTDLEMEQIAESMVRQTLVGAQLSDIEVKIAVHISIYIAKALRDKPTRQVEKAVARIGPN